MFENILKTAVLSLFGFGLGIRHALDADHIATISNLVSEHKSVRKAAMLGVAWGIGHTLALLAVGVIVIALKLSIPKALEHSMEFLVGVVLVYLGVRAVRKALTEKLHMHRHTHPEERKARHSHLHYHEKDERHMHKTFAIGILHGLAGSAAIMLLVVATISSLLEGIAYILIFGIGTILGMLLVSALLSIPFTTGRLNRLGEWIKIAVGIISIGLGALIMYEMLPCIAKGAC